MSSGRTSTKDTFATIETVTVRTIMNSGWSSRRSNCKVSVCSRHSITLVTTQHYKIIIIIIIIMFKQKNNKRIIIHKY